MPHHDGWFRFSAILAHGLRADSEGELQVQKKERCGSLSIQFSSKDEKIIKLTQLLSISAVIYTCSVLHN